MAYKIINDPNIPGMSNFLPLSKRQNNHKHPYFLLAKSHNSKTGRSYVNRESMTGIHLTNL